MDNYVEKSISVRVAVRTACNQWTQFEEFPKFMDGVKDVRQLHDQQRPGAAGEPETPERS